MQLHMNHPNNYDQLFHTTTNQSILQPVVDNNQIQFGIQNSKQFHDMFVNSIRINKKLHGEILAKEYSVKNEAHQFNIKLQSLYRDMEDLYSKTQQMYEQTVRQNQKTRFMAEELLKPFRDELKGKVDETTLSLKMKMMLSEFDNIGHQISYDKNGNEMHTNDSNVFNFIRGELLPLISNMQDRLNKNSKLIVQQNLQMDGYHTKQQQSIRQMMKMRQYLFEYKSDLIEQIDNRMNDEIWYIKLQNFKKNYLQRQMKGIIKMIDSNKLQFRKQIQDIRLWMDINMNRYISDDNNRLIQMRRQIDEINRSILRLNDSEANRQNRLCRIQDSNKQMQCRMNNMRLQGKSINSEQLNNILNNNKLIKNKIQSLQKYILVSTQNINRLIDNNNLSKINKIQQQILIINENIKNMANRLKSQQKQINIIKQIVSHKANFTDIILHIENKANKQDYQELKSLIQTNHIHPENSEDSTHNITSHQKINTTTTNKFRKKYSPAHRKNYHQSASPFKQTQREQSIKRYMLGLKNNEVNIKGQNLLKQKAKHVFSNQNDRRRVKIGGTGQLFTQNFIL